MDIGIPTRRLTPEQALWLKAALDIDLPEAADPGGDAAPNSASAAGQIAAGSSQGREQAVSSQVAQTSAAALAQPATSYDGDVYRAVSTQHAAGYADHSQSSAGRYNAPGQSALYTSPTKADIAAEAQNYDGLDGKTVVQSTYKGDLLDARNLPGIAPQALSEPYGSQGDHRSVLSRLTGEDPYTLPRTVADVARERGLSGVMAPANQGNTNIALFPDAPDPAGGTAAGGRLQQNLQYVAHEDVAGGVAQPGAPVAMQPNIPDGTPNRSSPAGNDPAAPHPRAVPYEQAVAADAQAHGRATGARYGAVGAAAIDAAEDIEGGHFSGKDAVKLTEDTAVGAATGAADSAVSRGIDQMLRPPAVPLGVAGGAAAEAEALSAGAATRPVGLGAGMASGGLIGGGMAAGAAVWNDADRVRDGTMKAGDATADVVVNAGVGIGAGVAGAAAGAAIGSIVPVAGTAVGAALGFGAGLAASYVTTKIAEHSGAIDAAKKSLGHALDEHFEKPLEAAWHEAAKGVDAVKSVLDPVETKAAQAFDSAKQHVADTATGAAHAAGHAVTAVAEAAHHAAAEAQEAVHHAAQAAAGTAAEAAHAAEAAAQQIASHAADAAHHAAAQVQDTAHHAVDAAAHAAHEAQAAVEQAADKAKAAAAGAAQAVGNALENAAGALGSLI